MLPPLASRRALSHKLWAGRQTESELAYSRQVSDQQFDPLTSTFDGAQQFQHFCCAFHLTLPRRP